MLLRIKELNREKRDISQENELLVKKLEEAENLLDSINRYWSMLNENLASIQRKYQPELDGKLESEASKRLYDEILGTFKRSVPEYSKKVKQEKKNEFDYLESRCDFTTKSFQFIIQTMLQQREESSNNNKQLRELLEKKTNTEDESSALNLLMKTNQSLEDDLNLERSRIDELTKNYNDSLSQIHELTAERNSFEKQLFLVQQQRDDFEANNMIIQRKVDKLLEQLEQANLSSNSGVVNNNNNSNQSTAPPRPSAKVPPKKAAAAAAATYQQSSEILSMSEELKKLKDKLENSEALCNSRLAEIEKLITEKSNLNLQIQSLQEQMITIPPEKIKKSKEYIEIKNQLDKFMINQSEKEMQFKSTLQYEYEKNFGLWKENYTATNDSLLKMVKDSCVRESQEAKNQLENLRKEREEISYRLTQLIEVNNYSKKGNTNDELKQSAELYRKELNKLRDEMKSISTESMALKNSLMEKKLAEETLKQTIDMRELEIKKLKFDYDRLSESLKDIQTKEKVDLQNENTSLRDLIQQLQNDKFESSLGISTIILRIKEYEELQEEKKKLNLQLTEKSNQVIELQNRIESDKNFTDQLFTELTTLNATIQDRETKNDAIMQQLLEKEDCVSQLLHEYSKSKQQEKLLKEQVSLQVSKIAALEEKYKEQSDLVTNDGLQARKLASQLENALKDLRQKKMDLENKEITVRDLRNAVDQLQGQLSVIKQNYDEFKTTSQNQITNLTREASKTYKLEEEKNKLKKKFDKLKLTSKKTDTVMEEELLTYKNMVKCPICHERHKNAIITKCFHVFCRPCIDSVINLRQRRCPTCQKPFTGSDVHDMYLNF